jgi:hypothetical protein
LELHEIRKRLLECYTVCDPIMGADIVDYLSTRKVFTMTPEQALNILNQATEPGMKLGRRDYVVIQQALDVLAEAIKPKPPQPVPVVKVPAE